MHELFDHTADLGLRAKAADLGSLFAEMAQCLLACMVEDEATVLPTNETTILIEGTDPEFLMFDWLRHLLDLFEEGWLYSRFELQVSESGLSGIALGEPLDRARHQLSREVKAITYHELKVIRDGDEWLAEAIVDI